MWGSPTEDGTFNGMVGMLERGEVFAGLSGFALLDSRAEVADFTMPIGYYKLVDTLFFFSFHDFLWYKKI